MLIIIGPTASGKTGKAVALARAIGGEIISADSRQLYRGMDLGTGKDLDEYGDVPYHMIDICEAGYKYNLYEYLRDYQACYDDITSRGKPVVLCGGTGMYVESVVKGIQLPPVPENRELREQLSTKSLDELTEILKRYKTLRNNSDIDTCKRAIRAIEIAMYYHNNPHLKAQTEPHPLTDAVVIGIDIDRDTRRRRITERHLTLHVIGQLTYDEMFVLLETAIHQFAKRQMTWFRGMERRGTHIHWLPYDMPNDEFIAAAINIQKEIKSGK